MALSGSTAIVGAFGRDSEAGAAYIFERSWNGGYSGASYATHWQLAKRLQAPDSAAGLAFGYAVAVDGGLAVVTALRANDGKAYVFGRNYGGTNNWGYMKAVGQPATGAGALEYATNLGTVHRTRYWSDGQEN